MHGTGWVSFVAMGIEHIIGGIDHLMFLLGLLALARGLWQTVQIVTAFTVAHSVTLSLASLGLVDVPSRIVEPLIAASIVWVAVENLVAPAGVGRRADRRHLRPGPRLGLRLGLDRARPLAPGPGARPDRLQCRRRVGATHFRCGRHA